MYKRGAKIKLFKPKDCNNLPQSDFFTLGFQLIILSSTENFSGESIWVRPQYDPHISGQSL